MALTYDYECTVCKHTWEASQSILAEPLTQCPACGRDTARRLISSPSTFVLRGVTWGKDGYGSKR